MDAATQQPKRRSTDWTASVMAIVTVVCLVGAGWLRFQRTRAPELPAVGSPVPALELIDLETSEALVLLGQKGKVVWVVFWSADAPSGPAMLKELARVWPKLRPHRRFTLAAAAIDTDHPERVRAAAAEGGPEIPVYLATAAARRRFGVGGADPPVHLLIGPDARVTAMARGDSRQTIERIAEQAKAQIDQLDPAGETRFASIGWSKQPR
jgi:hypothetical protein